MKKPSIFFLLGFSALFLLSLSGQVPKAEEIPLPSSLVRSLQNQLEEAFSVKGSASSSRTSIWDRLAYYHIPSVSLAIIHEGKVAWVKAYGLSDKEKDLSANENTLYQAASISKFISAIAALELVEEGKLHLDQPVNEQLISWKIPENEWTKQRKVILRDLLSHQGGLTVSGFPGYLVNSHLPTIYQSLEGIKPANTVPIRVENRPGVQWKYSGGGYLILQLLMTDITHLPFNTLMQKKLFEPLRMARSTFAQPLPQRLEGEAATGYLEDGSPVKGRWHVYPELAAAGLWSTPTDLAKCAIAIQECYQGKRASPLSQKMTREMLTPQINQWGLGPKVEGKGENLRFLHAGNNEGFTALLMAYANRGEGVVIMTNGHQKGAFIQEVLENIALFYQWPDLSSNQE